MAREKLRRFNEVLGRGSWIRTNDLQYPKLPRYQAALYPDLYCLGMICSENRFALFRIMP
jgi:hypothetical protein